MIRKRVVVSGGVQGVFFRDTCRAEAVRRRVAGWVRNLSDGDVEAVFEGEPGAVDQLVAWTGHGPPTARVERVAVFEEAAEGLVGFVVLPTIWS